MFRRNLLRADANAVAMGSSSNAGLYQWVDKHFLNNKKPPVPGGSWSVELLQKKSLSDLQQIWFILLKERNMLLTMKAHYTLNQEELGAMPAPSRLNMVQKSMDNLKAVCQERDREATELAMAMFEARVAAGIYRYPPGPPLPPTSNGTSTVTFQLSKHVSPERLRELFGKFDVYSEHKGLSNIEVELPAEVMAQKEQAETAWEEWQGDVKDYEGYTKASSGKSMYDTAQHVVLAPGKFLNTELLPGQQGGEEKKIEGDGLVWRSLPDKAVFAKDVAVPEPQRTRPRNPDPVKRLREGAWPVTHKRNIQLGHFPNITLDAPAAPGPRPTHPDEIEGPWNVTLTYDSEDGFNYAAGLNISRVDGADVSGIKDATKLVPQANQDIVYQEALNAEAADEYHQKFWPMTPDYTEKEIESFKVKPLSEIIEHNYSNTVDYLEREALLTAKSVWDLPMEVDASCGQKDNIPHNWEEENVPTRAIDPKAYLWDEY